MRLDELKTGQNALVKDVQASHENDLIARRLRDLGFVSGEPVRIVARAPLGGDPLLVTVGFTRFALRRTEAARINVAMPDTGVSPGAAA
ncbi:MAG: ferrous iron transport protein A [Xanthomonadales bacterium]|nr:ferrous iron transport protein A [Xanthomonadales bacterium]